MNLEDRIKRRLVMEEPGQRRHNVEIGQEVDPSSSEGIALDVRQRIEQFEHAHPHNLLAQTKQAPRPLELVLDEAAVISKFPQEEK